MADESFTGNCPTCGQAYLAARLAEAERLLDQCYNEADFEGPAVELLAAEVDLFLRPTDSASAVCPHGTKRGYICLTCDEEGKDSASPMQCPCGALYLKVEGGYVPTCTCSVDNTVTVAEVQK